MESSLASQALVKPNMEILLAMPTIGEGAAGRKLPTPPGSVRSRLLMLRLQWTKYTK